MTGEVNSSRTTRHRRPRTRALPHMYPSPAPHTPPALTPSLHRPPAASPGIKGADVAAAHPKSSSRVRHRPRRASTPRGAAISSAPATYHWGRQPDESLPSQGVFLSARRHRPHLRETINVWGSDVTASRLSPSRSCRATKNPRWATAPAALGDREYSPRPLTN